MGTGSHGVRTSAIALGVALTIHSAAAIAILRVHTADRWRPAAEAPVEVEVPEPRVPPPEARPESVAESPPDPAVRPRLVPRVHVAHIPPVSSAPPPANRQPPPDVAPNAPPVFGVTMSSVVSGDAAMAVSIGNTTMTQNRSPHTPSTPTRSLANEETRPFAPVPEIYIATPPRKLYEVNTADIYPPESRTLGIEGTVKLSVDLDEKGRVVAVRLIQRAGHGFDEAAARAMPKFRFSPALTSDGRAVPVRFTYQYRFTIGD
jgi:protein TonB